MKNIQNPTDYFFEQANNPPDDYREEIDKLVTKLINLKSCILCREDYNFQERMPRILIHCGHTLCTSCLTNFYKNQKVRCPLCLKLIKNIESLERLPVNHTIFIKMGQELNKQNVLNNQEEINIQGALYAQFESSSQPKQHQYYPSQEEMLQQQQNGPRIDEETGLEWCEKHYDRIKHFFCMVCYTTSCRVCSEEQHSGEKCNLVDLYDLEDIQGFLQNFTPENMKKMQEEQKNEQKIQKQQADQGEDSEGGDDEGDEDEEDDEDEDDENDDGEDEDDDDEDDDLDGEQNLSRQSI